MFAKYLQDQGLYKKASSNENDNALETHKLRNARFKEEEEKKLGAVLKARKGPNAILQSNYLFRVYYFDLNNGRINYNNVRNTNNWHQALDAIKNSVYNGKIKRDKRVEFLLATQQGGAFYCSAGFDTDIGRRLLGYAMRTNTFKYRPIQGTAPVFFSRNVPEHEQRFFAIVKDLKSGEVKKYQLTMNNQGKAQKQFRDLTAGGDKIGSLGKAERANPRWIQHKTKDGYKDVELALGEFAQKKLGLFKSNDVTVENAELTTRDQLNKAKAEYLKGYSEHVKKSQKAARDLGQEARADKKLANRYVKPIKYTIFTIRDGARWENKARTDAIISY